MARRLFVMECQGVGSDGLGGNFEISGKPIEEVVADYKQSHSGEPGYEAEVVIEEVPLDAGELARLEAVMTLDSSFYEILLPIIGRAILVGTKISQAAQSK